MSEETDVEGVDRTRESLTETIEELDARIEATYTLVGELRDERWDLVLQRDKLSIPDAEKRAHELIEGCIAELNAIDPDKQWKETERFKDNYEPEGSWIKHRLWSKLKSGRMKVTLVAFFGQNHGAPLAYVQCSIDKVELYGLKAAKKFIKRRDKVVSALSRYCNDRDVLTGKVVIK